MDIIGKLKEELNSEKWQVEAVIKLIDEGNTIPFIARYRKEQHGNLSDEVLRNLSERLVYLRNLEEKKATVLPSIPKERHVPPLPKKRAFHLLRISSYLWMQKNPLRLKPQNI